MRTIGKSKDTKTERKVPPRNLPPVKWMIHTRKGETFTDRDKYPHDVPEDQITSVERVVNSKVFSITKSKGLFHTFFVKTTASREFSPITGGVHPTEIHERIVGCHIDGKDGPIRIEMTVHPETGDVKLTAVQVTKVDREGFSPTVQ